MNYAEITDILNYDNKWIITKFDHKVGLMSEFEVQITGIVDGPDGSDWVIIEGAADREISMPLNRFREQARLVQSIEDRIDNLQGCKNELYDVFSK